LSATLIDQAWGHIDGGEPASALAILEPLGSSTAPALLARGVAHLDAGNAAQARECLEKAASLAPDNVVAKSYLALARWASGDAPGAAEAMSHHVLFPQRGYIERLLRTFWPLRFSSTLRRAARPAASREVQHSCDYNRFLAHEGKVPAAKRRRLADRLAAAGQAEFDKGDYLAAVLQFERAHQLDPEDGDIALLFVAALLAVGRSEDAFDITDPYLRASLAEARAGRPAFEQIEPRLLVSHAAALHDMGRHRDALLVLSGVRHPEYEDAQAHFTAATCWLMLGNEEAFRDTFRTAMDRYFLDTWDFRLTPFCRQVAAWLATPDAAEAARGRG
jgi:tetratricopeptide (TPR) repeat protein